MDDQGSGTTLAREKAERVVPVQPWEEVTEQGLHEGLSESEGKVSG